MTEHFCSVDLQADTVITSTCYTNIRSRRSDCRAPLVTE